MAAAAHRVFRSQTRSATQLADDATVSHITIHIHTPVIFPKAMVYSNKLESENMKNILLFGKSLSDDLQLI